MCLFQSCNGLHVPVCTPLEPGQCIWQSRDWVVVCECCRKAGRRRRKDGQWSDEESLSGSEEAEEEGGSQERGGRPAEAVSEEEDSEEGAPHGAYSRMDLEDDVMQQVHSLDRMCHMRCMGPPCLGCWARCSTE